MLIRDERPADATAIFDITERAFAPMPFASRTEQYLTGKLRDAGALTISLVAEDAGRVVGHVAFSSVLIDGRDVGCYGLGPVSVEPGRQRSGIGSLLIDEGLARLHALSASACVLEGDPNYYQRFGFSCDPDLIYGDPPSPYIQGLAIHGPAPKGVVTFHPAFEE